MTVSRRAAALLLPAAGWSLLLLNVLGLFVGPAGREPVRTPSMIAGRDYAPLPPDDLRKMVSAGAPAIDLAKANTLVFLSLRHSDQRRIGLLENWLLWSAGHFYEPLSRTQDTDRLVAGRIGLCGEKAQVLKTITERAGLPSRFVNLNGHVVLEVQTGSGWQLADPDYGVTYPSGIAELEKPEGAGVMRRELARMGYDQGTVDTYVAIVQSAGDNVAFPVGQPLSPRLYRIERASDTLKWVIPLLLAALGLLRKGPRAGPAAASPR